MPQDWQIDVHLQVLHFRTPSTDTLMDPSFQCPAGSAAALYSLRPVPEG